MSLMLARAAVVLGPARQGLGRVAVRSHVNSVGRQVQLVQRVQAQSFRRAFGSTAFASSAPAEARVGYVQSKAVWNTRHVESATSPFQVGGVPSDSKKNVFFSSLVVNEGERLAIWDSTGKIRIVEGPQRVTLYRSTYQYLQKLSASSSEYISIEYVDGRTEHLKGPISLWQDPAQHKTVSVCRCVSLNEKESIVVYRRKTGEGQEQLADIAVQRSIIKGPALYVPTPGEWTHRFRWGESANEFTKVNMTPDTMEVQVEHVRTADDGALNLNLMVHFELADVEKILNHSKDPIVDITNAMTSDVILATSKTSFQKLKDSTEVFNDLKEYPETLELANKIGIRIHRIAFKGYQVGEMLQYTQDQMIRSRAELQLQEEREKQSQVLLDMQLQKEHERVTRKQELEVQQVKSKIELAELQSKFDLNKLREKHALEVQQLHELKKLGVDLTAYLVSRETQKPDKVVQVIGNSNNRSTLKEATIGV